MDTIGDDLIVLAVRPNGKLGVPAKLRFGLAGSELVRLAAARRVDVVRGRIAVLDATPTGDELLDAALGSMRDRRRQPTAKQWVARSRAGLVDAYLNRLAAAGTIRAERRLVLGAFPATRWVIADTARLDEARARLDAIALGSGEVDAAQAALGGLAEAIGLAALIYPGFAGRAARGNLKKAGKRQPASAVADAGDAAVRAAAGAAVDASIRAATDAAVDASIRAATDAAVAASVAAATQAAVSAADHGAAGHDGGGGGGHH
jgi:hypothetical protein